MSSRYAFVLVGMLSAGKSTLLRTLTDSDKPVFKTQTIEYGDGLGIDTPGEFFSSCYYHSLLVNISSDIDTLVFVHPANVTEAKMPPGLLTVYPDKRFITVITKIDEPDAQTDDVENILRNSGIQDPIFRVNALDKDSVRQLSEYLNLS